VVHVHGRLTCAEERAPDDDIAIRVRGVTNRFGEQVVHEGLDLDVRRGEVLGVVGGSGSGKSVLMRSIIGLRRPMKAASRCSAQTRSAAIPRTATTSSAAPGCCSRTARCSRR
jgi:ABC-type transporter Mla maintaining outer membrane lipid asymmetry ATPase subunit MlaF